jgi:hypothetical protein
MNKIKNFSSYKESIDNDKIWNDISKEYEKYEKSKKKLKFGRFVFNPKTKEESLKLQEKLFSFGYKWVCEGETDAEMYKYIDNGPVQKIQFLEYKYIFVDEYGLIQVDGDGDEYDDTSYTFVEVSEFLNSEIYYLRAKDCISYIKFQYNFIKEQFPKSLDINKIDDFHKKYLEYLMDSYEVEEFYISDIRDYIREKLLNEKF